MCIVTNPKQYNHAEQAPADENNDEEQQRHQVASVAVTATTIGTGKKPHLWSKVKKGVANCKARSVTGSKNTKESIKIIKAKMKVMERKKAFGVEYLDLVEQGNASDAVLETCVDKAIADIAKLKEKMARWTAVIAQNNEKLKQKLSTRRSRGGRVISSPQSRHGCGVAAAMETDDDDDDDEEEENDDDDEVLSHASTDSSSSTERDHASREEEVEVVYEAFTNDDDTVQDSDSDTDDDTQASVVVDCEPQVSDDEDEASEVLDEDSRTTVEVECEASEASESDEDSHWSREAEGKDKAACTNSRSDLSIQELVADAPSFDEGSDVSNHHHGNSNHHKDEQGHRQGEVSMITHVDQTEVNYCNDIMKNMEQTSPSGSKCESFADDDDQGLEASEIASNSTGITGDSFNDALEALRQIVQIKEERVVQVEQSTSCTSFSTTTCTTSFEEEEEEEETTTTEVDDNDDEEWEYNPEPYHKSSTNAVTIYG